MKGNRIAEAHAAPGLIKPGNINVATLPTGELTERVAAVMDVLKDMGQAVAQSGLTVIRATTKSQVFLVNQGQSRVVVKLHENAQSYKREVWAYLILRGLKSIPELRYTSDPARALVLSYHPPLGRHLRSTGEMLEVAKIVGLLHGRAASIGGRIRLREEFRKDLQAMSLEPWVRCKPSWLKYVALELSRATRIEEMPSLGDIGPSHLLKLDDGIALCDLETFGFGLPSVFDLVLLRNLCSPELLTSDWTRVVTMSYVVGRLSQQPAFDCECESLAQRLDALVEAIG